MAAESSGNYLTAPLQANVLETLPTSVSCEASSTSLSLTVAISLDGNVRC